MRGRSNLTSRVGQKGGGILVFTARKTRRPPTIGRGRLKEKYSCHHDGICDGDCVMTPTTWSPKLLGPSDVVSLQAPATVGANARAQARASARKRARTRARKYAPSRARKHEITFILTHQTPHQAISVPPSINPFLIV